MISRRTFLGGVSAACAVSATGTTALGKMIPRPKSSSAANDAASLVDVTIGTGGHGHCFPGAVVPFGAVQLSPDTYNDGWDWCSGYHISDTSIMGFSHTHLSGTGCGDLLDFLVMPGTGESKLVPGSRSNPDEGYRSRFDHKDEHAEPGYYSVLLKDYGIHAELTATERTGLHRYTFPSDAKSGHIIVDLEHGYQDKGTANRSHGFAPAHRSGHPRRRPHHQGMGRWPRGLLHHAVLRRSLRASPSTRMTSRFRPARSR